MRILLNGGAFNPAGLHHLAIARAAKERFEKMKIILSGPRPDKLTVNDIDPVHRAVMADLTFGSLGPGVEVDLTDLELDSFTRTFELDARHAANGDEVWHLVGSDWILGGKEGASDIHRVWAHGPELWSRLRFAVVVRKGISFDERDLPPKNIVMHLDEQGSSQEIRRRAADHLSLEGLVAPPVAEYVERNGLYRGGGIGFRESKLKLADPRPLFVVDERKPEAVALAECLRLLYDGHDPNFIVTLGGDGQLLRAIQEHWRLRLPFFPVHFGTRGFLLNDVKDEMDGAFFRKEFTTIRSPLFHVEAVGRDGSVRECLAFNDAWMQVELGNTGWFEVKVDGRVKFPRLMADGVLASTAAGSTAYARAMGAKPILIGTNKFVLAGSNVSDPPHWKNGANIPLESVIELQNVDSGGYRKTFGFADNIRFGEIVSLKIRMSRIAAPEIAYLRYDDMSEKLFTAQFS